MKPSEAGLAMDMAIAKHVMGWKRDGEAYVDCEGHCRTIDLTSFGSFQPSTDIAAAMQALEKIGGIVRIARLKPDEWHVTIGGVNTWWADTLPLAICRTLLAAADAGVAL